MLLHAIRVLCKCLSCILRLVSDSVEKRSSRSSIIERVGACSRRNLLCLLFVQLQHVTAAAAAVGEEDEAEIRGVYCLNVCRV